MKTGAPSHDDAGPASAEAPSPGAAPPASAEAPSPDAAPPAGAEAPSPAAAPPAGAEAPSPAAAPPAGAEAPSPDAAPPAGAEAPSPAAAPPAGAEAPSPAAAPPAGAEAPWLIVRRGDAPLLVSLPHTGTAVPPDVAARLVSPWRATKDTDWWIERLYGFAAGLDATLVRTSVSRSMIDVNRDPSGASLYPGQATTGLCPTTTFDGEPLYRPGLEPDAAEVELRRHTYFEPYHAALRAELARLRSLHRRVVLYDGHSIRSRVPRLFEGLLPVFNIGTNSGASCAPDLVARIERVCDATGLPRVTDGRFKGGFITRHHGDPAGGIHAVQMELACRGYLREAPGPVGEADWPVPYDAAHAAPMAGTLRAVFEAALAFTGEA